MEIMIFVEGTLLKPSKSPRDFSSYIPTDGALSKVKAWSKKATISYLTSRKEKETADVKKILDKHGFPDGEIFFRRISYDSVEDYVDVVHRVKPDIMINDTCESIGFFDTIEPRIEEGSNMKAITVNEFEGLKDLSDDPKKLRNAESVIEIYEPPQGRVFVIKFTKNVAAGFFELKPDSELDSHQLPVKEFLKQVYGDSVVKIGEKEVLLSPLEEFEVPVDKDHVHSNHTEETSLTFWMFEGDVTKSKYDIIGPD